MASLARPSVWRHRDFVKLWSAATVSVLGSQVTVIALPYIALTMLGASVLAVAAVAMLPFLLFTLPAGAWLDRTRRRPVLIAADIGRGIVLLSIPAAYVLDALSLWQLFAVAFVHGTLTAVFDVADQSYLPEILDRDALVDGNANLQISTSVAQIGGPVLGGNLIAAPMAIAIDALSFFISGAFLSAIRRRDDKPSRRLTADGRPTSIRADIAEGLRYVLGHRYLRPIAACTGTSNLFSAALFGIFPVLIWDELRLPPAFFGTVVGLASVGFLVGAALSNRLPRAIGVPKAMELMLTGRMIDAQEAVDMGLVNKVVPHEELGDAVLKTARAIAANGRNAVRLTKRAVRAGQDIDVQAGCEIEASIWALSFDEERTARMTAFLEKRKK